MVNHYQTDIILTSHFVKIILKLMAFLIILDFYSSNNTVIKMN